jgi:hypothetical protein
MEKQTAVEWLIEQFNNSNIPSSQMLFKQAKEMEKQQVIDAFNDGYRSGHFDDGKLGSKYYQEYF